MIEIKNLNKYYKSGQGAFHALKDINLTFPDKGIVFIAGKSGSGKSTLLNIIGGIDSYDSGDLIINNVSTKEFKKKDYNAYRNSYIGFIFQEFNVIKSLTVYENIALSIQLHNKSAKKMNKEILDVIEQVGLKGKEHRRMNQISGGERQRVAIARSLIKNPDVIIADEPTGNLDPKNRDVVMSILKSLAKDRLVIIVTHDTFLANSYGERTITLKDGEVISDVTYNEDHLQIDESKLALKSIQPSLMTSFLLGLKSFKLNIIRYILIILLFSVSLIFAGSVVNLFLADTTLEYANYQDNNNNFVVELNKKYEDGNISVPSGFNLIDYEIAVRDYTGNDKFTAYKSTILNFPVKKDDQQTHPFYADNIERVNVYDNEEVFKSSFSFIESEDYITNSDYTCYITDYVAEMLIHYNYFDNSAIDKIYELKGKKIKHPYFRNEIVILNIINTPNYFDFWKDYNTNNGFKDRDSEVAFKDNLPFYNAIYMNSKAFYSDSSTSLIRYNTNVISVTDDIIYEGLGAKGYQKDVAIKTFTGGLDYTGRMPVKPEEGEPTQIAISKGVLEKLYKRDPGEPLTFDSSTLHPGLLGSAGGLASFKFTGIKRSQATYNFIVTAVVNTDEFEIYLPSYTYQAYLNNSFNRGGVLVMTTNADKAKNADIYRQMFDSGITINNLSFKKLQLVDDFINDNLFLFAAMFFVFCLFSVLMIFNFIIINIKNSTRDIGIYMSLGMNGFKIAMIYFFQVLIVSVVSLIIGLIGSAVFLAVLDAIFSSQSPINFAIIKYTFLGILAMAGLAFVTPSIAVIIPLFDLGRKKPIDVIKVS